MFTNKDFSALFIVQSFPKWFVHFWITFCKNSIRISCQVFLLTNIGPNRVYVPLKVFYIVSTEKYKKTLYPCNEDNSFIYSIEIPLRTDVSIPCDFTLDYISIFCTCNFVNNRKCCLARK